MDQNPKISFDKALIKLLKNKSLRETTLSKLLSKYHSYHDGANILSSKVGLEFHVEFIPGSTKVYPYLKYAPDNLFGESSGIEYIDKEPPGVSMERAFEKMAVEWFYKVNSLPRETLLKI
jgi:hypothetical protein